jgi:hypothetical protein
VNARAGSGAETAPANIGRQQPFGAAGPITEADPCQDHPANPVLHLPLRRVRE